MKANIGLVIMAAGSSTRFGENKLLYELKGKSIIQYAMEQIPTAAFYRVVVVTQYPEVEGIALSNNFVVCKNDSVDLGLSHTIELGINALKEADAVMFMVADQPLLKKSSIEDALILYREHPDKIVTMSHEGRRGNPCIFPKEYFDELLALTGDHGGRSVIELHEDDVLYFELADEKELVDIDEKHIADSLQD